MMWQYAYHFLLNIPCKLPSPTFETFSHLQRIRKKGVVKIMKKLLLIAGVTFILIGIGLSLKNGSYNDTQNSLDNLFGLPIEVLNQMHENPTTFNQDEFTFNVLSKGGILMFDMYNLERDIILALACFSLGITLIITSAKKDFDNFIKSVFEFLF